MITADEARKLVSERDVMSELKVSSFIADAARKGSKRAYFTAEMMNDEAAQRLSQHGFNVQYLGNQGEYAYLVMW